MSIRFDDARQTLTLSVRDLVSMGLFSGATPAELPTTASARMADGRRAHQQYQAQYAHDVAYTPEASLRQLFVVGAWTVDLSGRVDELIASGEHIIIEEVKSTALPHERLQQTTRKDWDAWARQLEVYLWLYAQAAGSLATGRLVLVSLVDGSQHGITLPYEADAMNAWVHKRVVHLVRLHTWWLSHQDRRKHATLKWPFTGWRAGQTQIRDLAFHALDQHQPAMIQAPTGIGKTAAVLHGALTWAARSAKSLYWATSRNTQIRHVQHAIHTLRAHDTPLTVVTLQSKASLCLQPVVSCRADTCPYAADYFDKVDDAKLIEEALSGGGLTPTQATKRGKDYHVCPFQLLMDVASYADIVVGDSNFVFRPPTRPARLLGPPEAPTRAIVVDEAHQLAERVREHLSPTLRIDAAEEIVMRWDRVPTRAPFTALARRVAHALRDALHDMPSMPDSRRERVITLDAACWHSFAQDAQVLAYDHARLRAAESDDDLWIDFAYALYAFDQCLQTADEGTLAIASSENAQGEVRLLCLDPSTWLRPMIPQLAGFIAISATLSPQKYHQHMLGLPDDAPWLDLASPFPSENRRILVSSRVSTRFRDRAAHADATAMIISEAVQATPGHAAVYFSSFAMLQDIAPRLSTPRHTLFVQSRHMTTQDQNRLLHHLRATEPCLLLAVLGGVFAEGIDPPPSALKLVVIVGLGLPPVGLARDLLAAYYEKCFGRGMEHASLVPGMIRVIQAAGRLIRRDEDRGVILLVGRRYRWRDVRAHLPAFWDTTPVDHVGPAITSFWAEDR